jgi:hypothetical protein
MFRFTIRDVLWLTVVVGLIVGWWIDHRYVVAAARDDKDWADIARDLHSACTKAGWDVEIHHGEVVLARPPTSS